MTLRGTLNKNWVEVLGKCVENMNNTQVKKIGYLKGTKIKPIQNFQKGFEKLMSLNLQRPADKNDNKH